MQGLVVDGLSGEGFGDVSLTVRRGDRRPCRDRRERADGVRPGIGWADPDYRDAEIGRPSRPGHWTGDGWRAGIGYLSADRHHEGIFGTLSVRENAAISALKRFARSMVVRRAVEVQAVEGVRDQLRMHAIDEAPVASLSGEINRRSSSAARCSLGPPCCSSTCQQGVDAGARVEIYGILRQIAASGVPVLVISSDTLELEGLCDRVYVFSRATSSPSSATYR